MTLLTIILCIVSFVLSSFGFLSYRESKAIRVYKADERKKYKDELDRLQNEIWEYKRLRDDCQKEYDDLKANAAKELQKKISIAQDEFNLAKENGRQANEQYFQTLEEQRFEYEKDFLLKKQALDQEKQKLIEDIDNLKAISMAAIAAQNREKELIEKQNFYKLSLTKDEQEDIEVLFKIKKQLNEPVILSKLIWSTYFLKQANELCNRILSKATVCGIYKITNLQTNQCYIGQSVDIKTRWISHIKCGLGIGNSPTNKLYNAMLSYGVWNFTFEVLEELPKEQLNEREKFWIDFYQSNVYSYNSTKGNS